MNKKNLLRAADLMETIPQEYFDISCFRGDAKTKLITLEELCNLPQKCGTVGCVIGTCTILDTSDNLTRFMTVYDYAQGYEFDYDLWSFDFFGLNEEEEGDINIWEYLFSGNWYVIDNTPMGTAKRIRYVVEHGLPKDWYEQLWGEKPLSYI
jgi:hypothetical protein